MDRRALQEASEAEVGLAKALLAERSKKQLWRLLALVLLAVIVYNTKTTQKWSPDVEDGMVNFKYSRWWGLMSDRYAMAWRKETGASPEDDPRWCILWPDGTWHTFLWQSSDEEPPSISFPPTK
jgi:hypothetical protein